MNTTNDQEQKERVRAVLSNLNYASELLGFSDDDDRFKCASQIVKLAYYQLEQIKTMDDIKNFDKVRGTCQGCGEDLELDTERLCKECALHKIKGDFNSPPLVELKMTRVRE
jgi:hypothetical protein